MLNNARFSPDGQTVVYGAIWAGEPQRLYAARPGSAESRPFDMEADILAISSAGEMAILLGAAAYERRLALVPFAGGAARRTGLSKSGPAGRPRPGQVGGVRGVMAWSSRQGRRANQRRDIAPPTVMRSSANAAR